MILLTNVTGEHLELLVYKPFSFHPCTPKSATNCSQIPTSTPWLCADHSERLTSNKGMFCSSQKLQRDPSVVQSLAPGPAHCDLRGRAGCQPQPSCGTGGSSRSLPVCSKAMCAHPEEQQPAQGPTATSLEAWEGTELMTKPQSLL